MRTILAFLLILPSCVLINPSYKMLASRHVASATCEGAFAKTNFPSSTLQKFKNLFRARQQAVEVKQVVALSPAQHKKIKTIGIEFEGFYDTGKTHKGEIALQLLKYLYRHVPEKDLYPINFAYSQYSQRENRVRLPNKKKFEKFIQHPWLQEESISEKFVISYGKDNHIQEWQIKREPSVYGMSHLRGFEVSSPIIRSEASQNLFLGFLKELTDRREILIQHPQMLGKDPYTQAPLSRSGGLHIHIGKESFKREDQLMLIKTLYLFERQMFEYFNVSESRQKSSLLKSIREAAGRDFKNMTLNEVAEKILKNPAIADKRFYFSIRDKFNTLEFRFFESTADPKVIRHEIEFVTKLSQAILNKNPRLTRLIENKAHTETPEDFLRLLAILKMQPMRIH